MQNDALPGEWEILRDWLPTASHRPLREKASPITAPLGWWG